MEYFLGIDTSNYTTSMAVCTKNGIIHNEKILLDVKEGERGLRQSDALFAHVVNLPVISEKIAGYKFSAIGCSSTPRDVEGSYMPCFRAGYSFAHTLGNLNGVPVYDFSHQAGHITAAAYSAECLPLLDEKINAFHVSGGTTEILLCDKMNISAVGGSLDLNAGQAIDRAGVLLGLKFPCGPELERLAVNGNLPEKPKVCVNGLNCNLSGLENKVLGFIKKGISVEDIALYTIKFVEETLDKLSENLKCEYGLPILYAGGVMSNIQIKKRLSLREDTYFADKAFSADNAAGTAIMAMKKYYSIN